LNGAWGAVLALEYGRVGGWRAMHAISLGRVE